MNDRKRIQQVYLLPKTRVPWKLEDFTGHARIRYFSYGRHALAAALQCAGVQKGDRVLLPGFICRDVLSSLHAAGAQPVYYAVDEALHLADAPDALPEAKAIIAVNYFGFPQNLAPFQSYCRRTGAILIEDNAHGLFSRDEKGNFLGTRGDIGVFSLRKTIPLPDGAALAVNNEALMLKVMPQVDFNYGSEPIGFRGKKMIRNLMPWLGARSAQALTLLARKFRKWKTGQEMPASRPDAEVVLPGQPSPCAGLLKYVSQVDVEEEKKRRRGLYLWMDEELQKACNPVFSALHENVAPYSYPFYAAPEKMPYILSVVQSCGLQCVLWPDLPDDMKKTAPPHYKKIWSVPFLW